MRLKQKRLPIFVLLVVVALTPLMTLVAPQAVYADISNAVWVDKGEIDIGSDKYIDGKPDDSSRDFYKEGDKICPDVIQKVSGDNTHATLQKRSGTGPTSCMNDGSAIKIIFTSDSVANAAKAADSKSSDNEFQVKCKRSLFNPLTWFMCPLIEGAVQAANAFDNAITNELDISTDQYLNESNKTGTAFHAAWSSVRDVAMALLVLIALVMVISQAINFGPFDAYTVKKVLPRLLVAVVFIALSWPLLKFAIDLSNGFGHAVRAIIYQPFKDAGISSAQIDGGTSSLAVLGVGALGIGLGMIGLLSFGVTALLATIIGFFLLVLRKMLVLFLVILAPLGIACSILPNTQKAWKFWHEGFSGALLVFPIIAGFIAIGRVFAAVTNQAGPALLNQVVAFIAYFAPYFLIPTAFKLATGIFSTIAGAANDRSRGAFDRLKKGRQTRAADRFARASSSKLWNPERGKFKLRPGGKERSFGALANKAASFATRPDQYIAYKGRNIPGLSGTGNKLAAQINAAGLEQTGKLSQELQQFGYNDKALKTLGGMHGTLKEPTRSKLAEAGLLNKELRSVGDIQTAAAILSESDDETEKLGANALLASSGRIASLYGDKEMSYANVGGAAAMELSRQGFADGSDLAQLGNRLRGETSEEFAQSVVGRAQLMGQQARPDLKAGYGILYEKGKGFRDGSVDPVRAKELLGTIKQSDWLGAKASAVKKLSSHIAEIASQRATDANGNFITRQVVARDAAGEARKNADGSYVMETQAVYTPEAQAMREMISLGASQFSSSDTTAKVEWTKLVRQMHMEPELAQTDQLQRAMQERRAGGPPGPAAGGGDAGGGDAGGGH